MPTNPYHADLAGRDPIAAMRDTPGRIEAIVAMMTEADLTRSYAPGKWTAAQLLVHLAQTERADRARTHGTLPEMIAGHELHHMPRFEAIAAGSR